MLLSKFFLLNSMDHLWYQGINSIRQFIYPFTFEHIFYIIGGAIISTYISDYITSFRLLKWIYIGTLIVLIATLYKHGDDKKAAKDIFKLATL